MRNMPENDTAPDNENNHGRTLLTAVIAVIAIAFIGGVLTGDDDNETSAGPELDSAGKLGCQEFRRILSDLNDGILTTPEFRERARDMHNSYTSVADDDQIRTAGREMLAALTSRNMEQLADTEAALHTRCDHYGY